MNSRVAVVMLVLVVIAALGMGWLLLTRDPVPVKTNQLAELPESLEAPRKRGTPIDIGPELEGLPRSTATPAVGHPTTSPAGDAPAFVDSDPLVAEQAIWVPDYGPAVSRGGGFVEFEIVDAKGQELEAGISLAYELWRKLGRYWVNEAIRYDAARKSLMCEGWDQAGLEPGDYKLSATFGAYGSVKRSFHVSRGELRKERLTTPYWRRIITLNFIDQDGKPVPYLTKPPISTPPGNATVVEPPYETPAQVLRAPPVPASASGRGGSRSILIRSPRNSEVIERWPTDNGRWYLRVFAGGNGQVTVSQDAALYLDKTHWWLKQSDFSGPEWDESTIEMKLAEDYAVKIEARTLQGQDNPGNKSLLTAPINPVAPELDPNDLSTLAEGSQRLMVSVNSSMPVTPIVRVEYGIGEPKGKNIGPQPAKLNFHTPSGKWWLDLPPDSGAWVEWSAPNLLAPKTWHGERVELGTARVVEFFRTLTCQALMLPRPSATLAALGAQSVGQLFGNNSLAGPAPWQPDGTLKFWVPQDSTSQIQLGSQGSVRLFSRSPGGDCGAFVEFSFSEAQCAQLALSGTTIDLKTRGLILRAIGSQMEGLPFVEATVVSHDVDIASKRLRLDWLGSNKTGDAGMEECVKLLHQLSGKDSTQHDPATHRLTELLENIKDPASRDFMRHNAAWYDTRFKLQSNHAGYLCSATRLIAGKRYVLYLWSHSRDEFAPDKRIDFIASEGMTDLGAVMLPSHPE